MSQCMTANGQTATQAGVKNLSVLGGAMIIAGTTIGAGMFSLPSVSAGMWFFYSLFVLFGTWLCMCHSGLMILEANLNYPAGTSFDNIAKDCLARPVRLLNSLSVAFVLYILTYAYISGGGSIVAHTVKAAVGIDVPMKLGGFLFALVLAFVVWLSTRAVDRISTIMLGGMILTFFSSVSGLMFNVQPAVLFDTGDTSAPYSPFILATLPYFLTSFGYHGNVPGLVKYYNKDPKAVAKTIIYGSFLGLILYVCWQLSVLGNIPREEFLDIVAKGGNMGILVGALSKVTGSTNLDYLLQVFSHLAVATSFLGVTLGLFDCIADTLGFDDSRLGRTKTAIVTFVPPAIGGLFYPDGFIMAIGFAGLAATVFAVIVPAMMALATRRKFGNTTYRAPGGNVMLYVTIAYGITVAICHVLTMFDMLPVYGK